MKFNIVEQAPLNLEEIYPLFKEMYMSTETSVKEIKTELGISNSDYKHLRIMLKERTGIEIKPNPYNRCGVRKGMNSYIHERDGKFEVRRNRKYYGRFTTIEEARKHRDRLQENNWIL